MNRLVARIELHNGIKLSVYESSLPVVIGRDSDCEICIPISRISRHHCELYLEDDELHLRDTSTNGTIVAKRNLIGESVLIEGRTDVRLTKDVALAITPCDLSRAAEERRFKPDRRRHQRRQWDRRTADVSVVDFERRQDGTRRIGDRRVRPRRSASAQSV
jgi:hypothetical protein